MKQKRQKYYYDRKIHKVYVGDWIRVYNPSTKRGQVRKLRRCNRSPYRVIKVIRDVVHRVQRLQGRQRMIVHFNCLRNTSQKTTTSAIT